MMKSLKSITAALTLMVLTGSALAQDISFDTKVDYGTGFDPNYVTSADLDGDGDNDLAVANVSRSISVLLNNSDGTFGAAVNYTSLSGTYAVFAIDLDGDGDNDLISPNSSSGRVAALMNNGDGTFLSAVYYTVGAPRSRCIRLILMETETTIWRLPTIIPTTSLF